MSLRKMPPLQFQDRLLAVMEQKHHWAWPTFMGPTVTKAQLKIHYQQEYATYVRDFPVFLARLHGHNPPLPVRKMLAENIFEEDTGHLSLGVSHPELFLQMMRGLGYRTADFEGINPLPATQRYRTWLERISSEKDWVVGAAVLTIFVEGSVNDRVELTQGAKPKSSKQIAKKIRTHPLVVYHHVPSQAMDLIRAHQMVEAGHRHDAYDMVIQYANNREHQEKILSALKNSLTLWLRYRDGVARACRIVQE